ncbi:MAG: MFS transporter [Bdellovibrionales bacterium]|nr:MFS transporter [Bdellovibrionales bacterium]MCB0390071.1 MFS transporter [Bdellovibrionales bacterium]
MKKNKSALLVIFITVFVDLVGFGIVIPLSPYLAKNFGADALQVGLLMTIYSLFQFAFAPFWGQLSDKMGRRPIILLSLLGAAVAHLLFAFGSSLTMLFIARGLAGFFGGNISTAMAYIADVTESKDRSKGMALIGVAFGLGFILGPVIGGIAGSWGLKIGLLPPFGESFPALIASLICFINFVMAFFRLKESLPQELRGKAKKRPSRIKMIIEYYKRPVLNAVLITYFLNTLGMANMEASLFLFVKDKFSWSMVDASWGFAYVGVIMVIVQGLFIRRFVPKYGEVKVLLVGLILAPLGMLGVGLSESIPFLAGSVTLMAIGSSLINPTSTGAMSLLSDSSEQGAVMGTGQSLSALGRVLGPALGGWFYRDLSWSAPFYTASVMIFLGFVLIWLNKARMPDTHKV